MITRNAPLKIRLWTKTSLPNEEGCMLWTGTLDDDGYGVFKVRGKMLKAHRVSLILASGESHDDLLAVHSCRNRNCVAPAHLSWGTHKQNTEDRRRDGTLLCREKAPATKFTSEDVEKIREMYATGEYFQKDLAKVFDVAQSTIGRITRKDVWN